VFSTRFTKVTQAMGKDKLLSQSFYLHLHPGFQGAVGSKVC
jgi:hypothetical protein